MSYKIPVSPAAGDRYKISFPRDHVESRFYRTPCLGAIESELIVLLNILRHESELKGGYPSSAVSAGTYIIETALLLLQEHKQQILRGTPAKSLIGAPPNKALEMLYAYHHEATGRHVLRNAKKGDTSWFRPAHWDHLRQLDPDLANSLAPAPAGDTP